MSQLQFVDYQQIKLDKVITFVRKNKGYVSGLSLPLLFALSRYDRYIHVARAQFIPVFPRQASIGQLYDTKTPVNEEKIQAV